MKTGQTLFLYVFITSLLLQVMSHNKERRSKRDEKLDKKSQAMEELKAEREKKKNRTGLAQSSSYSSHISVSDLSVLSLHCDIIMFGGGFQTMTFDLFGEQLSSWPSVSP